jgi:Na+/H+-dicarboxylate symporter
MYLWKYWRESRILFLAVVCIDLGLFLHVWQQRIAITTDLHAFSGLFIELLYFQAVPLGFLAWLFGIFGIGHDFR